MPIAIPATHRTWLAYAGLVALLSTLCFSSVAGLLLDTHDDDTFRDHEQIAQDFTFFFSSEKEQPTGRPTVELLKFLIFLVWGNNPAVFHLLVVFFHVLASLLLAWTAYRLDAPLELGLMGGLLFLLNVAHFQAIYWISALDYPVALICSLGAILCYIDHHRHAAPKRLYAFYAILVLGVLAHPSAVAVWPFCLYWSWRQGTDLQKILRSLLPFVILLIPAGLLVLTLSPRTTATSRILEIPVAEMATILPGILRALLWLLSRLLTTAHWLPLPVYKLQTWELYVGALVLTGLAYLIWKKQNPPALWAVWILLSILPFLLLTENTLINMPVGPSRYLYPITAGSALLLAWIPYQLRWRLGKAGDPMCAVLLLALLVSSFFYLGKAEALSRYTSGRFYLTKQNLSTGTAQLRRAIEDGADIIDLEDAYLRLVLADIRNADTIEPTLQQARKLFPENVLFTIARLVLDSTTPDLQHREQILRQLHQLKDQGTGNRHWIAQVYKNVGDGFYDREEWDRAIEAYRYGLEFDPDRMDTRVWLGWVLVMTNRFTEAIAEYEILLQNGPHGEAHFNQAFAYLLRGNSDQARTAYAVGMERYGLAMAEKLGVLYHLQRLVALDVRVNEARHIIRSYWPERVDMQLKSP